eukprot:Sspe_Gene.99914::Locus_74056_Transcript_1_1_Confidence_1.000_Length_1991::g.99914::m.99914/K10967/KTR1_3; alpha 1,2-mannosyltransferase
MGYSPSSSLKTRRRGCRLSASVIIVPFVIGLVIVYAAYARHLRFPHNPSAFPSPLRSPEGEDSPWDTNLTTINDALLRTWGLGSRLSMDVFNASCLVYSHTTEEPLYGTVTTEDLRRFHQRKDVLVGLTSFLGKARPSIPTVLEPLEEDTDDEYQDRDKRGVWKWDRPGARALKSAVVRRERPCVAWWAFTGCTSEVRDPYRDLSCTQRVRSETSGLCVCSRGLKIPTHCGSRVTCSAVCRASLSGGTSEPYKPIPLSSYPSSPAKPRGVMITLTTSSRLPYLLRTLHSLPRPLPHPYILFNNRPFTRGFRATVEKVLCRTGSVSFEVIPAAHWDVPDHIDRTHLYNRLRHYANDSLYTSIPHMTSLAYRQMCRWFSGPFALHPALAPYDYYWRVDDDTKYFCSFPLDPILAVHAAGATLGYATAVLEIMATVPSLMTTILAYLQKHGRPFPPRAFLEGDNATYTGCHVWNNFAIGSLKFFRSAQYQDLFAHLDRSGGFFYERWGDAPVQSLGVAALAPRPSMLFLEYVGYGHDQFYHTPLNTGHCARDVPPQSGYRSLEGGHLHWSCLRALRESSLRV